MKLEVFAASKGDCFLLSWGKSNQHYLMIDSGSPGTYRFIKRRLDTIISLEAIIITHVDYDHVGGFIKLMRVKNPPIEPNYDIYINTPDLILSPDENDKVGYKHGIQFDKILKDKNLSPKGLFIGINETNIIEIKGLELEVLSPQKKILESLRNEWNAFAIANKLQEEGKPNDKVSTNTKALRKYDDIISSKESFHTGKAGLINASSIAFIITYNNKKILFLSDANPNDIYNELIKKGYSIKNKLKVDLFKVSHHGSKFNTSKNLLQIVECDSFLISTNGRGSYYHPHRETIVRIAEYSRKDTSQKITIYTNYNLRKSNFITPEEEKNWNISIMKSTNLEI